jgi:hypothetical protein
VVKAKKQVCIAWMAFGVAFIALIVTLGFNYFGTVNNNSPKIEEQLNQIKIQILELKQPKGSNSIITNVTLKISQLMPKKRN